jgi:hypothetical protein
MRMDSVRIARIPDEPDRLARRDAGPTLQTRREGDTRSTAAPVVVGHAQVVVEVDVDVRRAAVRVEVEHAARAGGRDVELHAPGLGGKRKGFPRRNDVDPLVWPLRPGVAEVVRVLKLSEDREDDPLAGDGILLRGWFALGRRARVGYGGCLTGHETKDGNKEDRSGCRPVAAHVLGTQRSGSRSKRKTLAESSVQIGRGSRIKAPTWRRRLGEAVPALPVRPIRVLSP